MKKKLKEKPGASLYADLYADRSGSKNEWRLATFHGEQWLTVLDRSAPE
jgi:hypothetical protein